MPAADSRSRSSSPYAVEQMAVNFHRSRLGVWWRWRSELAALLAMSGSFFYGWHRLGSWLWPLLILAVVALVLGLVPRSRRFLLARCWALFTRHRLQRSFWELRLHTRAGRLPLVWWISATPVGVRAWVMLRAGMTFEDFEDSAPAFAAACGARDCRVTASARWAWLLTIDVMRRDALGPRRVIRSPLADLPALDLDDVPPLELADAPAAAPVWPNRPSSGE
jgi:hypothetical protein